MPAMLEAMDQRAAAGIAVDGLCIKAFPFAEEVNDFIEQHDRIFVIEQNRDAQMRTLLINELEPLPSKLVPILHYLGSPITAKSIVDKIQQAMNKQCDQSTSTAPLQSSLKQENL